MNPEEAMLRFLMSAEIFPLSFCFGDCSGVMAVFLVFSFLL